ncbi:MAG: hypothetical protein J6T10_12260 [Methanobrevibacter sp.]|nr:hypothetical protein [Methanobrevibacter sp.]
MPTSTTVTELKINKLTKAQYNTSSKSATELWLVTDDDGYIETDQGVENVSKILVVGADGKVTLGNPGTAVADQSYDPTSTNAQAGTAVAQAVAGKASMSSVSEVLALVDWELVDDVITATMTVSGVTSSNVVFVSPAPTSADVYAAAGVLCTAQGTNSLTFTCSTIPSADMDVNVLILS